MCEEISGELREVDVWESEGEMRRGEEREGKERLKAERSCGEVRPGQGEGHEERRREGSEEKGVPLKIGREKEGE